MRSVHQPSRVLRPLGLRFDRLLRQLTGVQKSSFFEQTSSHLVATGVSDALPVFLSFVHQR